MTSELQDIVNELGDGQHELGELFAVDGSSIYGFEADGSRVATLWDELHARLAQTHRWPVIVGTERDVAAHREAAGLRRDENLPFQKARAAAVYEHLDSVPLQDAISRARSGSAREDALDHLSVSVVDEDTAKPPAAAGLPLEVPTNLATGSAHQSVVVALLPTMRSWECPLLLNFGGWNECPPPEAHAGQLARWFERWGAELVTLSDTTMELRVRRTPETWKAAFDLASAQAEYCPELVSRGSWNLRTLAEYLREHRLWRFWWT